VSLSDVRPLPLVADIDQYRRQATDHFGGSQGDLAQWYDFDRWDTLARWVADVTQTGSDVWQFERAVEAIIDGDAATLTRFLNANPELVRQRSMREHQATLLIYVGANGVEGFRQRTPKNIVHIAQLLLDAGAELDYVGKMYRGTTTLGLVATSVHPVFTGVQEELMQFLLDRGASMERAVAPDYTEGFVVNACLANGRPNAAAFLATRGAPLNIEGAAGVGRLDAVKTYFSADGTLTESASSAQLNSALKWACHYGRLDVVEFLLPKGINLAEKHRGETPLHMAAYGGRVEIARLLLAHGAPLDVRDDSHEGLPLGWALYGWSHPPEDPGGARHRETVELLIAAGSPVDSDWLNSELVRADPAILAALTAAR
jgi:hypothetical protein